jgi:hypothetical protein
MYQIYYTYQSYEVRLMDVGFLREFGAFDHRCFRLIRTISIFIEVVVIEHWVGLLIYMIILLKVVCIRFFVECYCEMEEVKMVKLICFCLNSFSYLFASLSHWHFCLHRTQIYLCFHVL